MGYTYQNGNGIIELAQDRIEDVVKSYMELVNDGATNKKKKEFIATKAQLNACSKTGLAHLMEANGCMGYIDKLYGSGILNPAPFTRAQEQSEESKQETPQEPAQELVEAPKSSGHQLTRDEASFVADELCDAWHRLQTELEALNKKKEKIDAEIQQKVAKLKSVNKIYTAISDWLREE